MALSEQAHEIYRDDKLCYIQYETNILWIKAVAMSHIVTTLATRHTLTLVVAILN